MPPRDAVDRDGSTDARIAGRVAVRIAAGVVAALGAAFVVWFVGFDTRWAVAAVLVLGPVGAVLATRTFEEDAPWDPPSRETPRGTRLAVAVLEESLAACDRLARPPVLQRLHRLLSSERDDRQARSTIARQVRVLLLGVLRDRGHDPAHLPDDDVVALLGADALTVLQQQDGLSVTSAAIARCLDAIERLDTDTRTSR
jgi:hypothetical protein